MRGARKIHCAGLLLISFLMAAAGVAATDAAPAADLPPVVQVKKALFAYPAVQAAAAGVRAEQANRERLDAGPHEFSLRLSSQQRRERPLDMRYREHEVGIERPLRLPGKAARDAELGVVGVEQAQAAFGDALHESARLLLSRWFEWLREVAAAREWQAQVGVLQNLHDAVLKKVGAGETAKMEALLSAAQLAQAQAQLAQAQARRERAATELTQHFPGIVLPAEVVPLVPQAVTDAPAQWRERILAHNHELSMARSAARRGRIEAQRLDGERLPDPTLGVTFASERDGQERVVGLQLTIPLAGAARAAGARAASAEAEAADAREALALARAEAEAHRSANLALGSHAQWQRLADAPSADR